MSREDSLTYRKVTNWPYQVFTTTDPTKIVRSIFMLNIRSKIKFLKKFSKKTTQSTYDYDFCFKELLGINKLSISINNLNVQNGVGMQP